MPTANRSWYPFKVDRKSLAHPPRTAAHVAPKPARQLRRITADMAEQIAELREAGTPVSVIASMLGLGVGQVRAQFP